MKKRLKRFLLSLMLVLSVFLLAGCSGESEDLTIDEETQQQLEMQAQSFVDQVMGFSDEELDSLIEELNLDQMAVLSAGLTSWKTSKEDLGAYISTDSAEFEKDTDGSYTTVLHMTFENRKCDFTFGVDRKMSEATEVTFSPDYTMGEKMTDAAGNLIVGMGTVFIVLTLIMGVIYLFKFIPQDIGQTKEEKKAAAPAAAAPAVPAPAAKPLVPAAASAAGTDELQAVIAAAIAAYEADNGIPHGETLKNGLCVRSVRRTANGRR